MAGPRGALYKGIRGMPVIFPNCTVCSFKELIEPLRSSREYRYNGTGVSKILRLPMVISSMRQVFLSVWCWW